MHGLNDGHYFSQEGAGTIYNSKGVTINNVTGPFYWDGSDQNGQISAGFYILVWEDSNEVVEITIIK